MHYGARCAAREGISVDGQDRVWPERVFLHSMIQTLTAQINTYTLYKYCIHAVKAAKTRFQQSCRLNSTVKRELLQKQFAGLHSESFRPLHSSENKNMILKRVWSQTRCGRFVQGLLGLQTPVGPLPPIRGQKLTMDAILVRPQKMKEDSTDNESTA